MPFFNCLSLRIRSPSAVETSNQLLQLCKAHKIFSISVRLDTVMSEACRWLTNEKQRKTDIRLTDQ